MAYLSSLTLRPGSILSKQTIVHGTISSEDLSLQISSSSSNSMKAFYKSSRYPLSPLSEPHSINACQIRKAFQKIDLRFKRIQNYRIQSSSLPYHKQFLEQVPDSIIPPKSSPPGNDIKFWAYSSPKSYTAPSSYGAPTAYVSPSEYGPPNAVNKIAVSVESGEADVTEIGSGDSDDNGPSGGNRRGDNGGGGGGSGGGDGGRPNENSGDDGLGKERLTQSQIVTLAYAIAVALGGLIGLVMSGSVKSFLAGFGSSLVLVYVFATLPTRPLVASLVGFAISASLFDKMSNRYWTSRKFFPSGFVAVVSFIMTGGYVHGVVRSLK